MFLGSLRQLNIIKWWKSGTYHFSFHTRILDTFSVIQSSKKTETFLKIKLIVFPQCSVLHDMQFEGWRLVAWIVALFLPTVNEGVPLQMMIEIKWLVAVWAIVFFDPIVDHLVMEETLFTSDTSDKAFVLTSSIATSTFVWPKIAQRTSNGTNLPSPCGQLILPVIHCRPPEVLICPVLYEEAEEIWHWVSSKGWHSLPKYDRIL